MKKVLIIGANSISGRYLYNLLEESKGELFFSDLTDAFDNKLNSKWYKADFSDYKKAFEIMEKVHPSQVYNFAGCFSSDFEIDYKANVIVTKNIFDSIISLSLNTRVLLVGSAAEYGIIDDKDNPVNESQKLNPVSIYGLTKVFQTNLMTYYFNSKRIDVVMARTFNLFDKNISENLFVGRLFKQIDAYKKGEIDIIKTGNLINKRDYIDINTAVQRYESIMEKGKAGEIYNVGSGKPICIKDLLSSVLLNNGLNMDIVETGSYDDRYDVKEIFADISKLEELNSIKN